MLTLILVLGLSAFSNSQTYSDDNNAIFSFYSTFTTNFGQLNWDQYDLNAFADPCLDGFTGITCEFSAIDDADRIVEIDITDSNVGATFVAELGLLTKLRVLRLGGNSIIGEIFPEIESLVELTELHLENNHLSGSIPTQIGKLLSLTSMDLSSNELENSLPFALYSLLSLVELKLDTNSLTGPINTNIGNLNKLQTLSLSQNSFFGNFPTQIGKLASLQILDLDGNDISGSVPSIYTCSSLQELYLSQNKFTGSILTDIGNLSNLRILSASQQKTGFFLNGAIPSQVGKLSQLTTINLSANSFSSTFPTELAVLKNLSTIRLRNNALTGSIPENIDQLTNLVVLDAANNLISSGIPDAVGKLTQLKEFNLGNNDLNGAIPDVSLMESLVFLDLQNNNLDGTIPVSLGTISSLNSVNLVDNQIQGNVPANLLDVGELLLDNNDLSCPVLNYQGVPTNDYNLVKSDCDSVCTSVCFNGGTCSLNLPGFTCECPIGFSGQFCEIVECAAKTDGAISYPSGVEGDVVSFSCETGFTGTQNSTCQSGSWGSLVSGCTDIDECQSNPCHSAATCANSLGSFQCTCGLLYYGDGFSCTKMNQQEFTTSLGPVAYWLFNDTNGILDATDNGNDLSPHGRPLVSLFQEKNPGNKAVSVNRQPLTTQNTIAFGDNFAFSAIFNVNQAFYKSFNLIRVVPSPSSPNAASAFSILVSPSGEISIYYLGNTHAGSSKQKMFKVGDSVHVFVAVRSRNLAAVWVNGERIGIFPIAFTTGNYYVSLGSNMVGLVDEVAYFDKPFYSTIGYASYEVVSCSNACPGKCYTNASGHVCL